MSQQLRLLPAPKPLTDRLGAAFFRGLLSAPGVYRMEAEIEAVFLEEAFLRLWSASLCNSCLPFTKTPPPNEVQRAALPV